MRVLVVDDSNAIRTRLSRMLHDLGGVVVEEAAGAQAALQAAGRSRPDAVVLDIRLGDGSGLDVLEALKGGPEPPLVIMLTSHPSAHHRSWCEEHGADYFFDKAQEFERVLDVVAALRSRPRR